MSGRAHDISTHTVVDAVDDDLSEDSIAGAFSDWLDELDASEPLDLPVAAADELAAARDAGEVRAHR